MVSRTGEKLDLQGFHPFAISTYEKMKDDFHLYKKHKTPAHEKCAGVLSACWKRRGVVPRRAGWLGRSKRKGACGQRRHLGTPEAIAVGRGVKRAFEDSTWGRRQGCKVPAEERALAAISPHGERQKV